MKLNKRNSNQYCTINALCNTIAEQNSIIYEVGGDIGEGYYIKFGIPNKSGYEVETVDVDPTEDCDLILVIPKIYRAVRNLVSKRADMISDGIKDFADKKVN